jgi:PKD repeat protein
VVSGTPAGKFFTIAVVIAVIAILVPFGVSCSKPPAPVAAFDVSYVSGELLMTDPIAGMAPLTVRFTDKSTGDITWWRWNFGDGTPVVEGSGEEYRNPEHTYKTVNTGFIVLLRVKGPGGSDDTDETAVTVYMCSEAANVELNEAKLAIQGCLNAAGKTVLDAPAPAWDGKTRGMVTAGGRDAADYLRTWRNFKATYAVQQNGTIESGTDVSWGCVKWTMSITGPRWRAAT